MPAPKTKPFLAGIAACLVAGVMFPTTALAQYDVRLFLAETGVEFIEESVPAALPPLVAEMPTIERSFTCMDFEQRDTTINLEIEGLDIEMPSNDRIVVDVDFRVDATGEVFADDLYACFGSATCSDSMNLENGRARFDFDVAIVGGRPTVTARDVVFNNDPDDFVLTVDECGFTGSVVNKFVEFTEGWIMGYMEGVLVDLAHDRLTPMLENTLAGLAMDSPYIRASVEDLYFPDDGVSVTVDTAFPEATAAKCMEEFDKPGPSREAGASVPDIQSSNTDVTMAVNLGLLNQGMHTVWRQGLLCLTDKHIAALGVEVDLRMAGALLPGFPAGTEFGLDIKFTDYPRVRGVGNESSSLTLDIEGIQVQLHGDRPDGTRNTLFAEISLEATAKLGISPSSNAIYAELVGADITHLHLADERAATGDGFDVARIQQLLDQSIIPHMLHDMGPIPLTGPVLEISDYAILLRSIATNKAYASAAVDLFKIPNNDTTAPDTTIIDAPAVANAHEVAFRVSGSDAEIPSELLQYQVTVNGEVREPSFIRDVKIGTSGFTETYEVHVAAIDFAGNVDPSPATAQILVDGIVPFVSIDGARNRNADEGPANITWTMSDDLTGAEQLRVRVEVYDVVDSEDALSAKLIETQELPAGTTNTVVDLTAAGGIYRVEVHVVDEAGNDSRSSMLLVSASVGGCSTGGGSGTSSAALLLLALGLVWRRRSQN